MSLPQHAIEYLLHRQIAPSFIDKFEWRNGRLWFPVKSIGGKMLGKSRRDPRVNDGSPKYLCDKGLSRTLFLDYMMERSDEVIVTESELDALSLTSLGYTAVSSTTGAGSWNSGWDTLFIGKNVIFAYDADNAGRKGADKAAAGVARYAKNCKVLYHDGSMGKDVGEWLVKMDWPTFLNEQCELIDPPPFIPPTRYTYLPHPYPQVRESILELAERSGLHLKRVGTEYAILCLWHDEDTPSCFLNPNKNAYYCHGCSSGGGVVKFKERLMELNRI